MAGQPVANHALPRKASAHVGACVRQMLALPKAQLRASLLVLADAAERSLPLDDGGAVTERCAGYWVPDGTVSKLVAQLVFPHVYDALGAAKVTAAEARAMGYPARKVVQGRGRGAHWHLPAWGMQLARDALLALRVLGHVPEDHATSYKLAPPVRLPVTARGRRTWLHCPEHQDADPSALVNPSGVVWCFACARVVGIAAVHGGQAQYRAVLGKRQPEVPAPRRPTQAPVQVLLPAVPGHSPGGFFCALPISATTRPYSLSAAVKAGSPGVQPHRPAGRRPTGLQVVEPGAECFITPQPLGLVLGRRFADQPLARRSRHYGMARSYSSCMDLLDALRASQRQLAGERAWGRAMTGCALAEQHHTDPRHWLPDLYISLDHHAHHSLRAIPARGAALDALVLQPADFSPACTAWVGVDVDGIGGWPGEAQLVGAAQAIQSTLERHPVFSGRMALVRTSSQGAQVVAQLASPRWAPAEFYGAAHVQGMLAGLDAVCLRLLHQHGVQGGYPDPTVHAPGRMVRRPGPRVDKTGDPVVARLVWATP